MGPAEGEEQVFAPRGQALEGLAQDLDGAVEMTVVAQALPEEHPLFRVHARHELGMIEGAGGALGRVVAQLFPQQPDAQAQRGRRIAGRLQHLRAARVQVAAPRGVHGRGEAGGELLHLRGRPAGLDVARDIDDGGVTPRGLRVLEDELLPEPRRFVAVPLLLGDLGPVVKGEVAQGMAGGEKRLERLRRLGKPRRLQQGPAVQVAEPIRVVEVRVLGADLVELGGEPLPIAGPFHLDEPRRPLLHGQAVEPDLGRRGGGRRSRQRSRLPPPQRGAARGHGHTEREENDSDTSCDPLLHARCSWACGDGGRAHGDREAQSVGTQTDCSGPPGAANLGPTKDRGREACVALQRRRRGERAEATDNTAPA
jgi:hypothetical protein